ncbi:MAG: glycosyltransferase family 9 protein [Ignavibacteriae bacterium]|nr:glycosyltransferase family 9 protein [Ignavibacteriota bacterium]
MKLQVNYRSSIFKDFLQVLMKGAEPSSILIIRLSSMGDVILTTHLVRNLRLKYPNATINIILSKSFSEIYMYNPHITNLYEYNKSWNKTEIQEFKKKILIENNNNKYDLIIDLQRNFRSFQLRRGIGNRIIKVRKNRIRKLSLVYLKKNIKSTIKQLPDIYSDTVAEYQVKDDGKGLEFWLPTDKEKGTYLPFIKKSNIIGKINIAIAPGAFHYTKRWIPEKFAGLIKFIKDKYDAEIVIIGGKADFEITKTIIDLSDVNVIDKSSSDSIISTAEVIDKCNMLITNDTGVMHIAAARQVPVVAIFGSTVQEFGFTPFRVENIIVEKNVSCRPCTHIGRDKCPKEHFDCMNKISIDDVSNAVKKILNK